MNIQKQLEDYATKRCEEDFIPNNRDMAWYGTIVDGKRYSIRMTKGATEGSVLMEIHSGEEEIFR